MLRLLPETDFFNLTLIHCNSYSKEQDFKENLGKLDIPEFQTIHFGGHRSLGREIQLLRLSWQYQRHNNSLEYLCISYSCDIFEGH